MQAHLSADDQQLVDTLLRIVSVRAMTPLRAMVGSTADLVSMGEAVRAMEAALKARSGFRGVIVRLSHAGHPTDDPWALSFCEHAIEPNGVGDLRRSKDLQTLKAGGPRDALQAGVAAVPRLKREGYGVAALVDE